MNRRARVTPRQSGFSLIEIMIAVVILATGLLALAALQGRLAQASADAKVRSRVASMLTARLDELRAAQYANIPPVMPTPPAVGASSVTVTATCANAAWVCSAEAEGGVTGMSVTQLHQRYMSVGGAFQLSGNPPPADAVLSTAEFKRITLTASWTDASGTGRRLGMATDVSPLSLTASQIPSIANLPGAGGQAVVRQDNPAGPGVIPIAIGGGDATAASNPRPEVIGRRNNESIVGTRFDVLTYTGWSGPARIQRRVETAAIACKCQYGAGGDNLGEIYRTAQWPAEWTGERYELMIPTGNPAAPGAALASGPAPGVEQSPLCTDCCRDHHDASANLVKFDPQRDTADGYTHYNRVAQGTGTILEAVSAATNTQYLEACRLVRVDGFWRTATDMYAKHFGLLKTTTVGVAAAKTGEPDAAAVVAYQDLVKKYLGGYTGAAATIANATTTEFPITDRTTIKIAAPPTQDERYLHARGLYVDHLNAKAQARIAKARLPANCTRGDYTECMLPYLPFTTINATELAFWEPQFNGVRNNEIIAVATGSSLVYNPLQPTRGRTNAKAGAANGAKADAVALMSRSNAGVAIADEVDPDDAGAEASDRQEFQIEGGGTGVAGQTFRVQLVGLPQTADSNTSNDPALTWSNATGAADCNASFANKGDKDPNNYRCDTYGALGIPTTIRFANYYREYTASQTMTHTCGTQSVTAAVDRPTFSNFALSSAVVGGVAATSITPANDGMTTEYSEASFAAIPSEGLVVATFDVSEMRQATIASCVATRRNASSPWVFSNIVWNRPWIP